jgi:hypothetical protein
MLDVFFSFWAHTVRICLQFKKLATEELRGRHYFLKQINDNTICVFIIASTHHDEMEGFQK